MQKNLTVLFAVAVMAVEFATPTYAKPPGACAPWPGCKDEGSGEPPGLSTCNMEYATGGTCMSLKDPTAECVLVRFTDNTPGWRFTDDCQTYEPLVISPPDHILDGNLYKLLLAPKSDPVLGWTGGRAAIINSGGRAVVKNLTIHVAEPAVADGSCDGNGSPVEAGISFDPHPHFGDVGVPGMLVDNVEITVGDTNGEKAQFCNAIEIISQDNPPIQDSIHGSRVLGTVIGHKSYSNIGILVTNFNANDTHTNTHRDFGMENNRVHYSENGCVGIQVGPWVERANIQGNDVEAPGGLGCASTGVGISVLTTGVGNNKFLSPAPANIVGNTVDMRGAASVGISIVDSAIDKNEGNAIIGDPGDVPYCVTKSGDVPFPTNGKKKNTFTFNGDTINIDIDSVTTCSP